MMDEKAGGTDRVNEKANASPEQSGGVSWERLAKVFAAVSTIGGLMFHVMGYVIHTTYLSDWGLDAAIFPKSIDDIMMLGYGAFLDRSSLWLLAIGKNAATTVGLFAIVAAYLFIVLRVINSSGRAAIVQKAKNIPRWLADAIASLLMTLTGFAAVPVGLFVVIMVLILPIGLGASYGHSRTEAEKVSYAKGCADDKATFDSKCVEILKEGKVIARGFILDSSASHIGIFDVNTMRARAFPREGTEIVSDKLSKPGETKNPAQPKK